MKLYRFIAYILIFHAQIHAQIHFLCTAALIDIKYEKRKQDYIHAFSILHSYGFVPYIVESCKPVETQSFLNEYSNNVLHTNTNDATIGNKGVNEFRSILAALNHFAFDDNDIIVKMTGRYFFKNSYFIDYITAHPEIDAFIRRGGQPGDFVGPNHIFTGCFAMRVKHLKTMVENMDFQTMIEENQPVEAIVADYIRDFIPLENVADMEKIFVGAYIFFGDGTQKPELTHW